MPDKIKNNSEIQAEETAKSLMKEKKNKKDNDVREKNSPLFYIISIFTALLVVVLIIGGVMFFVIKSNANGISDNMRETLDKLPVLRLALPAKPEPEDEKSMTEEQVREKYTQQKSEKAALEKQLGELYAQIEELNKQVAAKDTNASLFQQQKAVLEKDNQKLTSDNTKLKSDFDELTAVIAKGDAAGYKKYFEKTDPKIAAELYEKILADDKINADTKKYVSIYEAMDTAAAAVIIEQLGTGKMDLIIDIMKNLKKETTAEILAVMTPAFSAKVSEELAKIYSVGTSDTTK